MSLQNAKKLEDLKHKAEGIYARRNQIIMAQRPKAIESVIKEMACYLREQGFELTIRQDANRGFTAKYKDIVISVSASRDDESFIGSDYAIEMVSGTKKKLVHVSISRGTRVDPQRGMSIEQLINDYENRLIPSLEALSDDELDGSYRLFIYAENRSGKRIEELSNGQAAIDQLFQND